MTSRKSAASAENGTTRRQVLSLGALVVGSLGFWPARAVAAEDSGISHEAESIHQEPTFAATPTRVYEALTESKQFDKVTQISGVMQSSVMAKWKQPTEISREVGGAILLFGGYIVGRNLELEPNERIVQA